MNNKMLHVVSFILLVAGGLNWLAVGLLEMNLVSMLLGSGSILEKAVYVLVGLSAVYALLTHKKYCSQCDTKSGSESPASSSPEM